MLISTKPFKTNAIRSFVSDARNNQSTKTWNSKRVEGEVWQLGYKPVEMTTKNKNRDMIAKFDDTLVSVLLFY